MLVSGREHILCDSPDRGDNKLYPNANFRNTGKALCGILKKGETFNEWKTRLVMRDKRKQEQLEDQEEIKNLRKQLKQKK